MYATRQTGIIGIHAGTRMKEMRGTTGRYKKPENSYRTFLFLEASNSTEIKTFSIRLSRFVIKR